MKPSKIFDVLDVALSALLKGYSFVPLFVGPPGVGKSQIVQAWCKLKRLPFIDLRLAYMECPDLIGFPSIQIVNGRQITTHNTPEFWPIDPEWEGVILFEEPNRATTSVMNCMMQILTDRKIHTYTLPKKAMLVGCINPDTSMYDVNTMDSALKDRFEIFEVKYDKKSFVEYTKEKNWEKAIISFVESGVWTYFEPQEVKPSPGSKYVSPRTLSKLEALFKAGYNKKDELMFFNTILGDNVGKDFYNFLHDESPVMLEDLKKDLKKSLAKLSRFSDPNSYKSGMISMTITDIETDGLIDDDMLYRVCSVIPADQGLGLIRGLEFKRKDDTFKRLLKTYPDLKKLYQSVLQYE